MWPGVCAARTVLPRGRSGSDMDETHSGAQRAAQFVNAVVCAGMLIAGYSTWQILTGPVSFALVVLLALTVIVGWLAIPVPAMPISFSVSDTFSTAAALVIGPAAGAVTAGIDGLMLSFRMQSSTRTVRRVLFNLAAPAVGVWL